MMMSLNVVVICILYVGETDGNGDHEQFESAVEIGSAESSEDDFDLEV